MNLLKHEAQELFEEKPDQTMVTVAKELWQIKDSEKQAKETYEKFKEKRMEMEETLNLQMEALGLSSFKTENATFYSKLNWYANVAKADQPRFFSWLRERDFGDLIFESVNARTLSAFAKDRRGDGGDLPDYLNVTIKKTIGMRKR